MGDRSSYLAHWEVKRIDKADAIGRVTGWDTPYPHAGEWQSFPVQQRLVDGIRKVLEAG